jgi:hypothetical protein
MQLSLDMIRRTEDGVLICAPKGEVRLRRNPSGISATYERGPLVNGTAMAYTQSVTQHALAYASQHDLPWRTRRDGSMEITDHRKFYEQTFNASTHAIETLNRWIRE